MGIGETASLLAAFLWALASLFYGKTQLSAFAMNFGKNLIASAVMLVHLRIESFMTGRPMFGVGLTECGWLAISGFVGIVIGDTFYFRSLQILGPRRALMVSTTSPIFAALLSWVFLSDSVGSMDLIGITLTLTGVSFVVADRRLNTEAPGLFPGSVSRGILFGLLGAICTGIGAITSKIVMGHTNPLEAALIRILASAVCTTALVATSGTLRKSISGLFQSAQLRYFVPAVLCGTWLGIWLSQVGYKYSSVAVALTLTHTTPVFVMPMIRIVYGIRITLLAVAGAAIAILGVYLTTVD